MSTTSKTGQITSNQFPYSTLIKVSVVLIFLVITALSAHAVYTRVRTEVANSDILPDITIRKPVENPSGNAEPAESKEEDIWTGTDRITVLILGIDERAQEEEDFWRTDTIMIGTLDPVTMQAGVLSIPRDLWVHIPGYTENRINTAHALGDAYDHPGGGPALVVQTIEFNLGIEVDYYVRFNFQAFVELVDRIGGIDIEVPETIHDPCYPTADYGCEELHIEAGPQHFFGDMALKYARVRYTEGGDFDRARRQQQVVLAIFDRITQLNLLPQLATQAPELMRVLGTSVRIDPKLQLDEMIAMANLGVKVNRDDIRFRVIDETCTLFKITPDEMMIQILLRERMREVRDEVFGLTSGNGELKTIEEEGATISILNGTEVSGLAYSTSQYLEANGIPIAAYDNADRQDYDTSMVILNREMPMTALQILSLLELPESTVVNGSNPSAEYDVVIILGADYAGAQEPTPTP